MVGKEKKNSIEVVMNIDDAIDRLSNCHPITKEDEEVFNIAINCMEFTKDFLLLDASPERMKQALHLLNSFEYALSNTKTKEQLFSIVGYDIKD